MVVLIALEIFNNDLKKEDPNLNASRPIMEIITKKEEKKEEQKIKPRTIRSSTDKGDARSFNLKFSPDLSVGSSGGIGVEESNFENVIFDEGDVEQAAIPIYRTSIPYPLKAKDMGIEGTVEMVIIIDHKGAVSNVDFVQLPHALFRRPVLDAVMQWKFKPAMNKGIPVKVRVRQSIEFSLEERL